MKIDENWKFAPSYVTLTGIYRITLANVCFVKEDSKSDCESDHNYSLVSGADPWWGFSGQSPKYFLVL